MDRDKWNDLAASRSQILQSFEWGELKSNFGWEPLRIQVNETTGISIQKRKLPFIKKCIFYSPRGPIVDFSDKKALSELIKAIKVEAEKHGALFLRIDPEVEESDAVSIKNLKSFGFKKAKKEIQPRATFILDLTKTEEEIMAGFESKFRYNIKLAERKGINVVEDISDDGLAKYYKLYEMTSERDKFIIHPFSYYKKVMELIIRNGMGSLFLAYYKGEPVAGVIVFTFGKRAWYMYGASSNEHRSLMPNNLLHWQIIKWAKERGLKEYDLWGIPANPNMNHPLFGVYRFKKGFNATQHKFIGTYDLPFNKMLYDMFDRGIILYQNAVRLIKKGSMSDSLGE